MFNLSKTGFERSSALDGCGCDGFGVRLLNTLGVKPVALRDGAAPAFRPTNGRCKRKYREWSVQSAAFDISEIFCKLFTRCCHIGYYPHGFHVSARSSPRLRVFVSFVEEIEQMTQMMEVKEGRQGCLNLRTQVARRRDVDVMESV